MSPSKEFQQALPRSTVCEECGNTLEATDWKFGRCPDGEVALSVVLCSCGLYAMAAAGSTDAAWRRAREVRSQWVAIWKHGTTTVH